MIVFARGIAAIFPRSGDFELSRMLRRWGALASILLLAGCPLLGGPDKDGSDRNAAGSSNNPAFKVALEGEGVSKTGPLAFRVDLITSAGPGHALKLSAALADAPLVLDQRPNSSAPDVVRVDAADRLTALKPGNARITVVHGSNRAELVLLVKSEESTGSFKVVNASMRDTTGPTQAFTTDNYKYGNGGMANLPHVWVTILGPGGKPIPAQQCELFGARVAPDQMPSGWADDDREMGGIIDFHEVSQGYNGGEEGMTGCGFPINGSGFPIIGSGVQPFQMQIHWSCVIAWEAPRCGVPGHKPCGKEFSNSTCGKPLPGGTVTFGIRRQGPDECDYCEGRK